MAFTNYSPIAQFKTLQDLSQARLNSRIIFGRLRVDHGQPGSYWSSVGLVPRNVRALSEARNHESVKLGEVLCARSIEPFEGGRWRLRWMRAKGWTRSNGYGN